MREETRPCRRANNLRRVPPLEVARCLLDCHATPSSPPIIASPSQEKGDAGRRCQAPPPLPCRAGNRGGRRQLLSPVVNSTRLAGVPLPSCSQLSPALTLTAFCRRRRLLITHAGLARRSLPS
nr:hypothetical protein Iba_chr12dCG10780 [Ipomoea batatas]